MKLRWQKSSQNKTLTGTLGGLSEATGLDYAWLRLIVVVVTVLTKGLTVPAYLLAVLLVPPRRPFFLRTRRRPPIRFMARRFLVDV
jgi:phage shock protein C